MGPTGLSSTRQPDKDNAPVASPSVEPVRVIDLREADIKLGSLTFLSHHNRYLTLP